MNKKIKIVSPLLPLLMSVISSLTLSSQAVEKLVKLHTKTNTYLSPEKVEMAGDNVYTFVEFNNKDTLFISGKSQDTIRKLSDESNIVVSKFSKDHHLKKIAVISSSNLGFRNSYVHEGLIYVFVTSIDSSVMYNGSIVWTASLRRPYGNNWGVMIVLNENLDLVDVKGIDHFNSGYDGIAFAKDRMYLFGYFTNETYKKDTIEIDGHKLGHNRSSQFSTCSFMLTYDLHSGKIINDARIGVNNYGTYGGTIKSLVDPEGNVFQLVESTVGLWYIGDSIITNTSMYGRSKLMKFNEDGDMEKLLYFGFSAPSASQIDFDEMLLTSDGSLILYGTMSNRIGINGVELIKTHLPYAAVLMSLDGKDFSLKWYDYMASEQNSSGPSIRLGGMTIDKDDNIYIMNSHGIDLLTEDRDGNTLRPGNHIYKYNKEGKRLSDYRSFAQFGEQFLLFVKGVDTLLIMKGVGLTKGSFDSLLNITNTYGTEMALFQFILNKISSLDDVQEINKMSIYPNPVHKDGILKISTERNIINETYSILDMMGRVIVQGRLDDKEQINLSPYHLRPGTYFIKLIGLETMTYKVVLVE